MDLQKCVANSSRASAFAASLISSAFSAAQAATLTYDWSLTGPASSLGGFYGTGSGTLTVTTGTNGDMLTSFLGEVNRQVHHRPAARRRQSDLPDRVIVWLRREQLCERREHRHHRI